MQNPGGFPNSVSDLLLGRRVEFILCAVVIKSINKKGGGKNKNNIPRADGCCVWTVKGM